MESSLDDDSEEENKSEDIENNRKESQELEKQKLLEIFQSAIYDVQKDNKFKLNKEYNNFLKSI